MKLNYFILLLCLLICIPAIGCSSDRQKDDNPATDAVKKVIKSMDGEPVVPREANRLYITFFQKNAAWSDITGRLVLKIREVITSDGRLAVVSDASSADLNLECVLTGYQIQNLDFDPGGRPIKKRMRITADVRMRDIAKKKLIFHEREIQSFVEFSDVKAPVSLEPQVREEVLENLAKRISSKTITGWYTKFMTPEEMRGKKYER